MLNKIWTDNRGTSKELKGKDEEAEEEETTEKRIIAC